MWIYWEGLCFLILINNVREREYGNISIASVSTFSWTLKWGSLVFACDVAASKKDLLHYGCCLCVLHMARPSSLPQRRNNQPSCKGSITVITMEKYTSRSQGKQSWSEPRCCPQFLHPLRTSDPNKAPVLRSDDARRSDAGTTSSISHLEMCQVFIFLFCLQHLPHNQWTVTWNYCNLTQDNMYCTNYWSYNMSPKQASSRVTQSS